MTELLTFDSKRVELPGKPPRITKSDAPHRERPCARARAPTRVMTITR